jgi:DNA-directed RNA polymerase subunit omega
MRDDYFKEALAIVGDPEVLVSMTAERVKMLRRGNRPLVEFPKTLSLVDVALREIVDGRIKYVLGNIVILEDRGGPKDIATRKRPGNTRSNRSTSLLANPPSNAMATA